MNILGLNLYHPDASACIVSDGRLAAAVEEERFTRLKHWAGFPEQSIRYCLREAGIGLHDVDYLAVHGNRSVNRRKILRYLLRHPPNPRLLLRTLVAVRRLPTIPEQLARIFPDQHFAGRIEQVEHHLAHLASAYYVSPFEEAAAVSIDGFGDFASAAWGVGRGTRLSVDGRVWFPHSLGYFYQAITQFLGFPHYGDEYKMMGLAPYGEPRYLPQMQQLVRLERDATYSLAMEYFRHGSRSSIEFDSNECTPVVGNIFSPRMEELLGPPRKHGEPLTQRHRDLARSAQVTYELAFFALLRKVHADYGLDSLVLAGGCAMNSVANGKVTRETPFRNVYVQAAAGDAGGALGAAFEVWHQQGSAETRNFAMDHSYWGPAFLNGEIPAVLDEARDELDRRGCTVVRTTDEGELCRRAAHAISEGRVVGWFQGRMEWGPRALGNRSILGDPRRSDMKDILNRKIKRRESFRPFAPSILRDCVTEWFETDDDVRFMMKVFQVRADKRPQIPAVTHVDGSGRLQTVHREANRRYTRLIEAFREISGVPIVLNTSFNENEPIVCRPQEALDCFLRTNMDVLVLGDYYVERGPGAATG